MTIVSCDVKNLEGHTAAFLSQDQVLMKELWDEFDLHTDNQATFNLPTRTIAKFFIFRILFGGSAAGFAFDPDFTEVGFNREQWQEVIDKFYSKYKGIAKWHQTLIQTATTTGKLVMPTGRIYSFQNTPWGEWPITQIKNYPVQGLGADLMVLYRVAVYKAIKELKEDSIKLISSVHDSLVVDCPTKFVDKVVEILYNISSIVPDLFKQRFGVEYNLPFRVEVSKGANMKDLEDCQKPS